MEGNQNATAEGIIAAVPSVKARDARHMMAAPTAVPSALLEPWIAISATELFSHKPLNMFGIVITATSLAIKPKRTNPMSTPRVPWLNPNNSSLQFGTISTNLSMHFDSEEGGSSFRWI